MTDHWTENTLRSRILDSRKKERFQAGSPNPDEIRAYTQHLPKHEPPGNRGAAVVLGMTPELRKAALKAFDHLYSIDINSDSISMYEKWLTKEESLRETVVRANWFDLSIVFKPAAQNIRVVFGDGVFGNTASEEQHRQLIDELRSVFPEAALVFRKILMPEDSELETLRFDNLIARFRANEIDACEFGFAARIVGLSEIHYNKKSALLDNRAIFSDYANMREQKKLSASEYEAILRYRFYGKNCVLRESTWEKLLKGAGVSFKKTQLSGKLWYSFYPVYHCKGG